MLLEKDAKQGMKAMHQAAKKDDKAALKLLIDANHSVNVRAPVGILCGVKLLDFQLAR